VTPSKGVAEEGEATSGRICRVALLSAILLPSVTATAGEALGDQVVRFDISRQRADQALISFAEQADVTFIFPVDQAKHVTANAVRGEFTPRVAVEKLLAGTGLQPQFQANGALTVSADQSTTNKGDTVKKRGLFAGIVAALSAGGAADVRADQTAETDLTPSKLGEVVVTAAKKEQALIDVPIAIQVYDSKVLEDLGANDFEDYARYAPGVSFTKGRSGQSNVTIRGLTTGNVTNSQPQNRSLVGIYLDDAPIQLTAFNYDPDLFDIARVEVLKGPQGTLFGDSAMAGAIRYVSEKPNLTEVQSRVRVTGSNTEDGGDNYAVRGMLNVPVSENVGLRGSFYYRDESGWLDNVRLNKDDINWEEIYGGRLSALYEPTEAFSIQATFSMQRSNSGGLPEADILTGKFLQDREREEGYEDALLGNLTITADLGGGTFTSVTGYIDRDYDFYVASAMERFMYLVFGEHLENTRLYYPWKQTYVTQEFRFNASVGERFEYTVGAFYANQQINYPTYGDSKAYGDGPGFDQYLVDQGIFGSVQEVQDVLGCEPNESVFCGSLNTEQKQIALFADATVHITPRLEAQFGLRAVDWEQFFNENYAGFFNGGPSHHHDTINEDTINPRFSVSYEISENAHTFLSAGKGFRFGGVNDPLPPTCDAELAALGIESPEQFDSDSLWSYELGAKTRLADNRIALNGSVFYTDWEDVQTTRFLTCGFRIIENAGKMISQGVEFDSTFLVTDAFEITVAASYTDATLDEPSPNLGADKGDAAPYVPTWKGSLFTTYNFPFGDTWNGFVNAGVVAQDESFTTFSPDAVGRQKIPGTTIVNLNFGAEHDKWRWSIFADNLTDETVVYGATVNPAAGLAPEQVLRTYGRPRTIGVEFEWRL